MNDENCIKYKVYDLDLYNRLIKEYWQKETPKNIEDYMTFCYHYEEWEAGLL